MKHYLSTFAGSAICGGFAFGIWPELWKTYGLMGGWLAATLIIGIMWYMNHYNCLLYTSWSIEIAPSIDRLLSCTKA